MSWLSRLSNVFRRDRVISDIEQELQSHLEEAIAHGRDPFDARRAFGSALHRREESLHIKTLPWLEAVRADVVVGWRRLMKTKTTTIAAVLSLALAIGACTSAFRLIDALLLRPLPIAGADRLYALSRRGVGPDGKPHSFDGWAYPAFRLMRAAVRDKAELLAISYAERADVTYTSGQEIERPYVQYVSGWMFGTFGLRPAAGRLLGETDDSEPHAHPYAVLSHDYWTRRFARSPEVGVVGDVPYRSVREPVLPAAYVPFRGSDLQSRAGAAFIVRTTQSPLALAPVLRQEVTRARREFRVSSVRTQLEINAAQTVRERLLAMLALFFTTVAVMLAGVGLYGVLEYSVVQVRREICIRLALGAGTAHIVRRVAQRTFSMVAMGALVGLALSLGLAQHIQALLYDVRGTDTITLALLSLAVISVALLAAMFPVLRASRIDPAAILRAD
jgi:hypothetical protein